MSAAKKSPLHDVNDDHLQMGGYTLTEKLGEGSQSVVFRAVKEDRHYALKMFKALDANATRAELSFRREAAIASTLNHPNLIEIIEVGLESSQPYLVTTLVEGMGMSEWREQTQPGVDEIVHVLLQVAEGLREIHKRGLVHRDVKPNNILIDSDNHATLIDFGFIHSLESHASGAVFAGTMEYASPEQLGIVNRPLDSRSDLYSLGVVAFELLAGQLPYSAENPAQLLKQLSSETIPEVRDYCPTAPPALSHIIRKLLEKDADDRYQSCKGLINDLSDLSRLDREIKEGQLHLDESRHFEGVTSTLDMIGRREELGAIKFAYEKSKSGSGRFVQIEGHMGTGKSRLVGELLQTAKTDGACVLYAKSQIHETIPLGPIREALDGFFLSLEDLHRQLKPAVYEFLDSKKGKSAFLLKRLCRSLATYYKDENPLELLDPESEKERFLNLGVEFILDLSKIAGHLVLWIDDVQWLDSSSAEMLIRITQSLHQFPVLVLTTARNDTQSQPALSAFSKKVHRENAQFLELNPLSQSEVGELVHTYLGRGELTEDIIKRVYIASNGNPFAALEISRAMIDGGCLVPSPNGWTVNQEQFESLNFSKDLVELLTSRISGLNEKLQAILSSAAVIGMKFTLEPLRHLNPEARSLRSSLEEAVYAHLLIQTDSEEYMFAHDSVREALLKNLGADKIAEVHRDLADYLVNRPQITPEGHYRICNHLLQGYSKEELPAWFADSGWAAANYALDNHSWQEAHALLEVLYQHREKFQFSSERLVEIGYALASCANSLGYHDECYETLGHCLTLRPRGTQKVQLLHLYSRALLGEGRFLESEKYLKRSLHAAGVRLPKNRLLRTAYSLGVLATALFLHFSGFLLGQQSDRKKQRRRMISDIYLTGKYLSYFQGNIFILMDILFRDLLNAHFIGPGPEYARAHIAFSYPIGLVGFRRWSTRHLELGMGIARQVDDRYTLAFGHFIGSLSIAANDQHMRSENNLLETIGTIELDGPIHEKSSAHNCIAYMKMFRGCTSESLSHIFSHQHLLDEWNNHVLRTNFRSAAYAQLTMEGRIKEAMQMKELAIESAELVPDSKYCWFLYYGNHLFALIEMGEFGPELDETIAKMKKIPVIDYFGRWCFVMAAYVRMNQAWSAKSERERRQRIRQLRKELLLARVLATTLNHRCVLIVLEGYLQLLKGRYDRAAKVFSKATSLAVDAESALALYEAQLGQARVALKQNRNQMATYHAERALGIAEKNGWTYRVDRIKEEFLNLLSFDMKSKRSSYRHDSSTSTMDLKSLNSMDVLLRISEICSAGVGTSEQTQNILGELTNITGAERAYLFLVNNETTRFEGGRSSNGDVLDAPTGYSSTVVKKVIETREPLVVAGTDEAEVIGSESAIYHNLRSIMASPLIVNGALIGVVYLDSRVAKGIFSERDLPVLKSVCTQIAISFETIKMAQVEANERAMRKDLELSAAVQRMLLPKVNEIQDGPVSLYGTSLAAAQCGGDWWWYRKTDRYLELFVGDVTGHGAGPAMITSSVASCFASLKSRNPDLGMDEILKELNALLLNFAEGTYLMTGLAAKIDLTQRKMDLWSAGGYPLIVLDSKDDGVSQVNAISTPLGTSNLSVKHVELDLRAGARLCFMTDGVAETTTEKDRALGDRRLTKMLVGLKDQAPKPAVESLFQQLHEIRKSDVPEDDVTVVIVDVDQVA